MITKEEYLASVKQELKIIRHLFGKILPATLDFRPTPKQRSMLELLQYLSHSGATGMEATLTGDASVYQTESQRSNEVTADNFLEKMDAQENKVEKLFPKFTEEELKTQIDLWNSGVSQSKAASLIDLVLKGLTAYRMQLFLYIKASGRDDIGTSDAWQGVDSKPTV